MIAEIGGEIGLATAKGEEQETLAIRDAGWTQRPNPLQNARRVDGFRQTAAGMFVPDFLISLRGNVCGQNQHGEIGIQLPDFRQEGGPISIWHFDIQEY